MAYENYATVAWTNGTPITGDRLQQMSINSDQIKDATDDNPKGVIKRKVDSTIAFAGTDNDANKTIIELKNETGGVNNSITLPANRFVKASFNFAGISISGVGGEDSVFELRLIQGTEESAIYTWYISPPVNVFLDASGGAPTIPDDFAARSSNPMYFGGGTYSHIFDSSTGLRELDGTGIFKIAIYRNTGSSTANLPGFSVNGPTHFWIEDIGGTA